MQEQILQVMLMCIYIYIYIYIAIEDYNGAEVCKLVGTFLLENFF